MRLGRMRWIDHWIGLPMCFTFGLTAMIVRACLPKRDRTLSEDRPLAVLKLFGLGSILEATPLLRAIRHSHPNAPLIFVTFDTNQALLRRLDNVCTELKILRTKSPALFVRDCLSLIFSLRRRRVQAVVDLELFSKFSTLLSFLSGAHIRIGYHLNDFWRRSLVTHPIYFNYFRHITDVFREAGMHLKAKIEDDRLSRLTAPPAAETSVRKSLQAAGWSDGQPLLGVNVNAGDLCLERRWPVDRFSQVVAQLLQERPNLMIALTGSPNERPYVMTVLAGLDEALAKRVFVAAGAWSLDEFLASLSIMDGLLTVDSGPMHLAAAQGTPIVSLWGPQRPDFYAPKVPHLRVLFDDYHCSPCIHMFTSFEGMWCNHEAWCMQVITPAKVLSATRAMLDEAAAGHKASPTSSPNSADSQGPLNS